MLNIVKYASYNLHAYMSTQNKKLTDYYLFKKSEIDKVHQKLSIKEISPTNKYAPNLAALS